MKVNKELKPNILAGKSKLTSKYFNPNEKYTIKNIYCDKLEKLYSMPPSNFGYKLDIEGIMSELALTKEQLFRMVINSLGRSTRTTPEIRVISSYLFLMQDFVKLLKAKTSEKKENLLLKDLITLGETIVYEKAQSNTVLMRFGEKGSNAYIILSGKVDVLIENYFHKNIGEKTYLYYLANLIKYHEFGLVNSIVNENFKKFPMEIIDDITFRIPGNNTINSKKIKNEYNVNNEQNEDIDSNNNIFDFDDKVDNSLKKSVRHSISINSKQSNIRFSFNQEFQRRYRKNKSLREKYINDYKKQKKKQGSFFKLSYMNELLKEASKIPQYSARELLDMFGLNLIDKRFDKRLNHIDINEYIKRLNILDNIKSDQLHLIVKKDKEPIEPKKSKKIFSEKNINKHFGINISNMEIPEEKSCKSSESEDRLESPKSSYIHLINDCILENINLCNYTKIISLETGALFGEMALNDPNALRKATIITSSDCHFGVLNKKTFNNSIKMGAQKHMKETLQFFIEIPIFNGIPETVFYNKYYTNLSKDIIVKGKNVINQGEKPEHITLLQTGSFGLTTQISLYDLTRLILYYVDCLINKSSKKQKIDNKNNSQKNNKKDKEKNNINKKENYKKESKKKEEKKNEINKLTDIQKILTEESALLAESIQFKKYYNTLQFIRITEIYSPEVILNDEFVDENGLYAFTIEAKAPENIIYTLQNKFLVDFNEKNISIQKNKEKYLKQKMDLMIKRLLIIRNSLINSFFDSKAKKEIGEAVIKELENNILLNLKRKRSLNKKEEIILNTNENEKKEKLISNNPLFRYRNLDSGNLYRNTGNSNANINSSNNIYYLKTSKLNNKIKPYKSRENVKFEYEFKVKPNKSVNTKFKIKLKPINVSLKTAIKYTNHHSEKHKYESNDSNRKSIILNLKNDEEGLLFAIKDEKNNNFTKANYNLSKSRNNGGKINFKSFSFDSEDKYNKFEISKTPKVIMNNLIWENVKSGLKFPIKLNIENNNINNFYDNNDKNTINTNYSTYYGQKNFYNRNKQKLQKSYYSNNNMKKNGSFSYDSSFHNMQIQYQNNFCFISPQEKEKAKQKKDNSFSSKKNDNSHSKIEQKSIKSIKSMKKNEILLKMRMKKFISPDEINLMRINRRLNYFMDRNKYNQIKEEKFKSNRKNYFKKNIMDRMCFFYGKIEK